MKNKYYTPKIEQIVVGFEYELQDDRGEWVWSNTPQDKKLLERCIKDGRCRALATTLFEAPKQPLPMHGVMCSNFCAVGAVREYSVELCECKEIAGFVEHWHYSKNVNELTTDYCFKLLDANGNMIGAMIYGKIAMTNVWKKYAEVETYLIELKRLCCIDNTPKNTESYFIEHTLRWLKKNTKIKIVISYADTTYSHE